jgi:hypothetical protein
VEDRDVALRFRRIDYLPVARRNPLDQSSGNTFAELPPLWGG